MTFVTSDSGYACLNDWQRPLGVNDVLTLLLDLRTASENFRKPVLLLVRISESVPLPTHFVLSSIRGTVPALLRCCTELVVVVEGGSERAALRAAFQDLKPGTAARSRTTMFETLGAAFAYAQRVAPHDVLDLQRHVLRQSYPPSGHG